jgi:aminoglycoside 6-adenylyltransferase
MRRAFGQESPQYEVQETRFRDAVKSFWLTAARTAKKLRRGEWWVAKHRCDVLMKELLRQMIEWHARATGGPSVDTWHSGHFLEEWADPRAIEELQSAFAVYDEDDIWRALLVTMELYRWLAQETGEALGYSYPSDADMRIAGLVRRLESGRKSNIP